MHCVELPKECVAVVFVIGLHWWLVTKVMPTDALVVACPLESFKRERLPMSILGAYCCGCIGDNVLPSLDESGLPECSFGSVPREVFKMGTEIEWH